MGRDQAHCNGFRSARLIARDSLGLASMNGFTPRFAILVTSDTPGNRCAVTGAGPRTSIRQCMDYCTIAYWTHRSSEPTVGGHEAGGTKYEDDRHRRRHRVAQFDRLLRHPNSSALFGTYGDSLMTTPRAGDGHGGGESDSVARASGRPLRELSVETLLILSDWARATVELERNTPSMR